MRLRGLCVTFALSLAGCHEEPRPAPRDAAEAAEPSPNASLLPAPLTGPSRPGRDQAFEKPIPATPLPLDRALELDRTTPIVALPSSGVSFTVRFQANGWPRSVRLPSGLNVPLDLALEFEILSLPNGLERLRVRVPKSSWLLPEGTEIRGRSDSLGHILVWPDARSYRVVPVGALLTLLLERRIDNMPRFAMPELEASPSKTAEVRASEFQTPMGTLRLEPRPASHPGEPSGELVCRFMAELVRARVSDLCVKAPLPSGGSLRLAPGSATPLLIENFAGVSDLLERRMLLPPELPIWKPGEYPPGALGPLSEAAERELSDELGLSPDEAGATDRVGLTNGRGLPLLLSIQDRPFRYLAPGERFVRRARGTVSYRAQGLLGGVDLTGQLQPGSEARLGTTPEIYPFGKGKPEESE